MTVAKNWWNNRYGRKPNNTQNGIFWENLLTNEASFFQYYERLKELAISRITWKGLPDTIDPRFLELCLFEQGNVLFFKDPALGYLTLKAALSGPLDVYNIPTRRRAYAPNGYQNQLGPNDSVIIWNNYQRTAPQPVIRLFAARLALVDRVIDVNVKAQRTPVLVKATESQRLTMLNLYQKYDGNEPFIFGDKDLNTNELFQAINTQAPYVSDKLYSLKQHYWNEALTYLGIPNMDVEKKERAIVSEVQATSGDISASGLSFIKARNYACKQIKKLWPELDIHADFTELGSMGQVYLNEDSPITKPPLFDETTQEGGNEE